MLIWKSDCLTRACFYWNNAIMCTPWRMTSMTLPRIETLRGTVCPNSLENSIPILPALSPKRIMADACLYSLNANPLIFPSSLHPLLHRPLLHLPQHPLLHSPPLRLTPGRSRHRRSRLFCFLRRSNAAGGLFEWGVRMLLRRRSCGGLDRVRRRGRWGGGV